MDEYLTRIHAACRKADYAELEEIVRELVFIGAFDRELAHEILSK